MGRTVIFAQLIQSIKLQYAYHAHQIIFCPMAPACHAQVTAKFVQVKAIVINV
jgi:hypothetical protein